MFIRTFYISVHLRGYSVVQLGQLGVCNTTWRSLPISGWRCRCNNYECCAAAWVARQPVTTDAAVAAAQE